MNIDESEDQKCSRDVGSCQSDVDDSNSNLKEDDDSESDLVICSESDNDDDKTKETDSNNDSKNFRKNFLFDPVVNSGIVRAYESRNENATDQGQTGDGSKDVETEANDATDFNVKWTSDLYPIKRVPEKEGKQTDHEHQTPERETLRFTKTDGGDEGDDESDELGSSFFFYKPSFDSSGDETKSTSNENVAPDKSQAGKDWDVASSNRRSSIEHVSTERNTKTDFRLDRASDPDATSVPNETVKNRQHFSRKRVYSPSPPSFPNYGSSPPLRPKHQTSTPKQKEGYNLSFYLGNINPALQFENRLPSYPACDVNDVNCSSQFSQNQVYNIKA